MDGRQNNGGKREGAGRKPKADELQLIERLTPLDDIAFDALKDGITKKDYRYVKLYYEYRFRKPGKQRTSILIKMSHLSLKWINHSHFSDPIWKSQKQLLYKKSIN